MGSTSATQDPPLTRKSDVVPDLSGFQRLREKTAVYWLGVFPGREGRPAKDKQPAVSPLPFPPSHSIDGIGGGVTFTEWFTPYEGPGQDGNPRRGQYYGMLVDLSETQVAQLREGLRCSLVRWKQREGRHAHGYIVRIPDEKAIDETKVRMGLNDKEVARLRIRASQFKVNESDEPVAKYVYCVKVSGPEAVAGGTWRPSTQLPKSVAEVGSIEAP